MTIADKEITGAKPHVESLEIEGYRTFEKLTIPKLSRVNLITGKNNVGKTSLCWARQERAWVAFPTSASNLILTRTR